MGTDPVVLLMNSLTDTLQFVHPSRLSTTRIALYTFIAHPILTDYNNRLQKAREDNMIMFRSKNPEK
jgi:hypothetical protein